MIVGLFDEEIGTFDLPGLQRIGGREPDSRPGRPNSGFPFVQNARCA